MGSLKVNVITALAATPLAPLLGETLTTDGGPAIVAGEPPEPPLPALAWLDPPFPALPALPDSPVLPALPGGSSPVWSGLASTMNSSESSCGQPNEHEAARARSGPERNRGSSDLRRNGIPESSTGTLASPGRRTAP